ncbi:MAG: hypothetical protein IPI34_14625 [bacterium]|nr:hypothetical protein [bacterium]
MFQKAWKPLITPEWGLPLGGALLPPLSFLAFVSAGASAQIEFKLMHQAMEMLGSGLAVLLAVFPDPPGARPPGPHHLDVVLAAGDGGSRPSRTW